MPRTILPASSWTRESRAWLPAVLLTLMSVGSNAAPRRDEVAFEQQLPRAVAALTAAGDADSLAAAAQLSRLKQGSARQLALLERAAALAPDRADLVWLEIQACTQAEGCDPTLYTQALHRLDPGNGAAWIPSIDAAVKRNDVEGLRSYLKAMGESERFDIYWNTSNARLTRALIKVGAYDARAALLDVIGVDAATSLPAFKNILSACQGEALQDAVRLATCRSIAHVLRNGDTYLTELLGSAMTKRLWPEGSAEYNDAVAARRLAYYRLHAEERLSPAKLRRNRDAVELLDLMEKHRSEQDLDEALLARAGVSTTPPSGWKPSAPGES